MKDNFESSNKGYIRGGKSATGTNFGAVTKSVGILTGIGTSVGSTQPIPIRIGGGIDYLAAKTKPTELVFYTNGILDGKYFIDDGYIEVDKKRVLVNSYINTEQYMVINEIPRVDVDGHMIYEFNRIAYARNYSESLVDFVENNEGKELTAYNDGQTIGYGFDMNNFPEIAINYTSDGKTITIEEADRLLRLVLDSCATQINDYLDSKKLQVDQNTFDALTDLYYNRGSNNMTKAVALAMAQKDDTKVQSLLLDDFDYRYALSSLYGGENDETIAEQKARAYVDRNPGLQIRRQNEYDMYKNGL